MNGQPIVRPQNCGNCFHKQAAQSGMECHRTAPATSPLITYVAVKDSEGYVMRWDPKIMGFVSQWPLVQPHQSCGEHSAFNRKLLS